MHIKPTRYTDRAIYNSFEMAVGVDENTREAFTWNKVGTKLVMTVRDRVTGAIVGQYAVNLATIYAQMANHHDTMMGRQWNSEPNMEHESS